MEYDLDGRKYGDELTRMADNSGLLMGVESFLRGLPDEVRDKLTAGELADAVINMIDNIRKKRRVNE